MASSRLQPTPFSPLVMVCLAALPVLASMVPGHAARSGMVLVLVLGLRLLRHGATWRDLRVPDWLAIVFAGLSVLMYVIGGTTDTARAIAADAVAFAALFVVVRHCLDRAVYFWSMVVSTVFAGLVMLANMYDTWADDPYMVVERFTFGALNSNFFAYTLAASVFLILGTAAHLSEVTRTRWSGAVVGTLAIFPVFGILKADSRGALLAAALIAVALVLRGVLRRFTVGVWASLMAVATIIWSAGVLDRLLLAWLPSNSREDGTLNGRLDVWPVARDHIADSPLFGHGVGQSAALNGGTYNHNALLDVGVDLGLVGVAVWGAWFYFSLRESAGATGRVTIWIIGLSALLFPILNTGYWHATGIVWLLVALVSRASLVPEVEADPRPASAAGARRRRGGGHRANRLRTHP